MRTPTKDTPEHFKNLDLTKSFIIKYKTLSPSDKILSPVTKAIYDLNYRPKLNNLYFKNIRKTTVYPKHLTKALLQYKYSKPSN